MKNDRNDRPRAYAPNKRHRKLIKPRLQLRLIGTFVGLIAISFLLQAQLLSAELTRMSLEGPSAGVRAEAIPELIWRTLALSFLVLLPLTLAVGILATFRLAGPVYRFEQYLGQVARGEDPGPCTIRRGDDLHELCERINEAVTVLRAASEPHRELVEPSERRAA